MNLTTIAVLFVISGIGTVYQWRCWIPERRVRWKLDRSAVHLALPGLIIAAIAVGVASIDWVASGTGALPSVLDRAASSWPMYLVCFFAAACPLWVRAFRLYWADASDEEERHRAGGV